MYNQSYSYLSENQLIYKYQSGFLSIHSVVTYLLANTNDWYSKLDEGTCTGIVLAELKKALDTMDHAVLAKKLSIYEINNTEEKWFCSYLNNRR